MAELEISIQEPYLSFFLNGQKTVEGRLYKGKFKDLKVGDFLLLGKKKILVEKLTRYANFRDMLESEGIENVIPNKNTLEEAEAVYHSFYTKDQEKEYSVIAITLAKSDAKN
jgi:ASC-1-like (ASCH) protein